jgi:hypothetical protein
VLRQFALHEISQSIARFRALQPLPELRQFVAALPQKKTGVRLRRRFPRWPLVGDVTVAPLDAAFRPIGPAFVACSRNISTGGICLYSTDRLHLFHQSRAPSDFVYLEIEALDSPPVQAVMKVLRQTRVDRFWEFAGKIWEAKSGLR